MYILIMLAKVAPILLIIIMGYIFQRTRFLKQETISDLKKMVLNITLPILLFLSFSSMQMEQRYLFVVLVVFTACALMLGVGILIRKLLRQENPYYAALFTGFEAGMMAYSLFIPVFGAENTSKVAIIQVGQTLFVFFILFRYTHCLGGYSMTTGRQLISFIKTPVIVSLLLGILASITGVSSVIASSIAGSMIIELMRILSSLTVPIISLVIGYELRFDSKEKGRLRMPILTSLLRLSIMILLATLINTILLDRILHLDWTMQAALYTIFLLPPPFLIPFNMQGAKEEHRQFVLTTISVHIILSLIAYVVFILVI